MKRVGNLYQKICSIENCRAAILAASRRKRRRRNVTRILGSLDHYAEILQKLLRDHLWEPAPYSVRYINDGIRLKRRRLAKPRFWPDQCIHHALDRVMEPVIMKGMDYYCCGSVRGRGAARAKKGLTRWIRRKPRLSKYVFKMDIHKYFDSISHEELMAVLRRKVKDPEVLKLYQKILDSYDAVDPEVSTEEHEIFKEFSSSHTPKESVAKSRLNKSSATPTGWTIYQGVHELKMRPEKNKVFILITDGYPSSQISEQFMSTNHIRRHIRNAEKEGIAFLCLLVGECEPALHHKLFGDSLVVANRNTSLAVAISPKLKKIAKKWNN